jgi:hypothetical protein
VLNVAILCGEDGQVARIFIDGFESGVHDMWDVGNATVVSSTGFDMDGNYCIDMNSSSEYLQKNITDDDEMYFALLYRVISATKGRGILSVWKDSTPLLTIARNGTNQYIRAMTGGGDVTLVTGTHALSINTTYLIEIRIKIGDAGVGRVEVKIDGVQDIDFTGDTKPGADTQFNRVRLGSTGDTDTYCYAYFDNFIVDDAGWIGDTKIQAILPTGAGATTGWTPSAGNNYACVDEVPPSDADYVSINAIDTTDTYAAGDLSGTIGTIKCVQVQSRTRTDGTPTPENLKLVVRSGGTDYLSADKAVPAAEHGLCSIWETNPADSAAWEEADVNGMEIGIRSAT